MAPERRRVAPGYSSGMEEIARPEVARRLASVCDRLARLSFGDVFDPLVPAAMVDAGLHRLTLPADFGGLGAGLAEALWVQAELGAIDGSMALGFAMHSYLLGATVEGGGWPEPLRRRLFEAVRDEGALINAAATEEGGGSPARGALPETRACRAEDGFRLSGEKTWTTWLPALRLALVTARILEDEAPALGRAEGPSAGSPLVGAFLVDLEWPGVTRLPAFEALGMRASASGRLLLADVPVPADHLVFTRRPGGRDPRGPSPQAWFGLCVAATYLGVGEGVRRNVTRWAIDRRPGDGSTAVAEIPSIQVRLGRLDATLRAARIVVFDVARRWEASRPEARVALMPDVALAKLVATNAAAGAADEALRIAGGPGFLTGPIERAFRDARAGLINPPLDDVAYQDFAKALIERVRTGG